MFIFEQSNTCINISVRFLAFCVLWRCFPSNTPSHWSDCKCIMNSAYICENILKFILALNLVEKKSSVHWYQIIFNLNSYIWDFFFVTTVNILKCYIYLKSKNISDEPLVVYMYMICCYLCRPQSPWLAVILFMSI